MNFLKKSSIKLSITISLKKTLGYDQKRRLKSFEIILKTFFPCDFSRVYVPRLEVSENSDQIKSGLEWNNHNSVENGK